MEWGRVAAKFAGLLGWTGVCYTLLLPGIVVCLVIPRRAAWNAWIQRLWARGLLRVLGVEVEQSGARPDKPFFLVANHLSYIDILVLGADLGAVFISKQELGGWPLLGHIAKMTGTLFVDRGRRRDALRVLEEIDRVIAGGAGVVLFPEGTSSKGDRIYPLKPALLEWAAQRVFPVHTAALRYATGNGERPAYQCVCWWGEGTPLLAHFLGLASLRQVRAKLVYGPAAVVAESRSALAGRLHEALEQTFVPMTMIE
jgi:1-acyl-sn-glycerol-3-phosphate acyltransferase